MQDILAASKPFLLAQAHPVILYLPAAEVTFNSEYFDLTRTVFENLAEVDVLDLKTLISLTNIESVLERATMLYIPGGNTYLLLDCLYRSGAFGLIQERIRAGMPLVGFSAGMVICGVNILTSNDKNDCGTKKFTGLGFTKYNFAAHYPGGDEGESIQGDSRIYEYHKSHANPVLALEDDGYVEIDSEGAKVVRGHCWLFEPGKEKVLLKHGYIG